MLDFNISALNISQIMKKHWSVLKVNEKVAETYESDPIISFKWTRKLEKKLYGPFLCIMYGIQLSEGYRAITRRQFTFCYSVPRSSWHSVDLSWKDERLSWPWSHPVVLSPGPLDLESTALTTRSLLHKPERNLREIIDRNSWNNVKTTTKENMSRKCHPCNGRKNCVEGRLRPLLDSQTTKTKRLLRSSLILPVRANFGSTLWSVLCKLQYGENQKAHLINFSITDVTYLIEMQSVQVVILPITNIDLTNMQNWYWLKV